MVHFFEVESLLFATFSLNISFPHNSLNAVDHIYFLEGINPFQCYLLLLYFNHANYFPKSDISLPLITLLRFGEQINFPHFYQPPRGYGDYRMQEDPSSFVKKDEETPGMLHLISKTPELEIKFLLALTLYSLK